MTRCVNQMVCLLVWSVGLCGCAPKEADVAGPALAGAKWKSGASTAVLRDAPDVSIRVGGGLESIAVGEGFVWVAQNYSWSSRRLIRIDPASNRVVGIGPQISRSHVGLMTAGEGAIWIPTDGTLLRIDPNTLALVAKIPIDGLVAKRMAYTAQGGATGPTRVAAGAGSVWVPIDRGVLVRIDPRSNQIVATITIGGAPSAALIAGDVWVLNNEDASLARIDPKLNQVVATVPLGGGAEALGLTSDGQGVWALKRTSGGAQPAFRPGNYALLVDKAANQLAQAILFAEGTVDVQATPKLLWIAKSETGLDRIDSRTGRLLESISLKQGASQLAASSDALWLINQGDSVLRINLPAAEVPAAQATVQHE